MHLRSTASDNGDSAGHFLGQILHELSVSPRCYLGDACFCLRYRSSSVVTRGFVFLLIMQDASSTLACLFKTAVSNVHRWTGGCAHACPTLGSRRAHAAILITEALQQLFKHEGRKLIGKQNVMEDISGRYTLVNVRHTQSTNHECKYVRVPSAKVLSRSHVVLV